MPMLLSHVPNMTILSDTSNVPQNGIENSEPLQQAGEAGPMAPLSLASAQVPLPPAQLLTAETFYEKPSRPGFGAFPWADCTRLYSWMVNLGASKCIRAYCKVQGTWYMCKTRLCMQPYCTHTCTCQYTRQYISKRYTYVRTFPAHLPSTHPPTCLPACLLPTYLPTHLASYTCIDIHTCIPTCI